MIRNLSTRFAAAAILSILFSGSSYSQTGNTYPQDTTYALRVVFVSFEGFVADDGIELSWSTILESNLATYEIQRSTDNGAFMTIGKISAKGSNSVAVSYNFKDIRPVNGKNIYRLKMIDTRNGNKYTANKPVNWGKNTVLITASIKAYPNPAKKGEALSIIVDDPGNLFITIFNISGNKIFSKQLENDFSQNLAITIPSTVEKGMYLMQVRNVENNKTFTNKIIVQ